MKKFFQRLLKRINQIAVIAVFLLAAIIITLLLPREDRFNYEYYRGRPWTHESLSANFRFPIYKLNEEIEAERDSVLKDLNYYFIYNGNIIEENLNTFRQEFENEWLIYTIKEYRISNSNEYYSSNRYTSLRKLQSEYFTIINDLLKTVFEKGIVSYSDIENFGLGNSTTIILTKGINAEELTLNQLYTPKQAYEYAQSNLDNILSSKMGKQSRRYNAFVKKINIEKYIVPNVYFDPASTEKEKNTRLAEVSTTKGMVQEGERIISEGEIVTQEKYQVLESLKREYSFQKGNINDLYVRLGKLLYIVICFTVVYFFLYSFRKEVINHFVKTVFILFLQVMMIFITAVIAEYDLAFVYIIPYAILPIIIRIFYDERLAFFIHVMTILMAAVFASVAFEFVVINIIAGMVAILSLTNLYRRSRFFLSAFVVTISYWLTYFSMSVVLEGSFSNFEWRNYVYYFPVNGLLVLMSFLLIYIFEKLFGFLSDTTLMELSDTNQPLLRKLAEQAPGTFQHSMQVANLAEEVALKIGGNPLLIRTGALYHDIGKIASPEFFTENQDDGFNPHQQLEYKKSAKVIINHITGGVELAKKNKLPNAIIDFIRTHQGTATVGYFYRMFKRENPDAAAERPDFEYPGPKPQTKEHAVLMMADTIEAASRSLTEYSEDAIDNLVETLVNVQMGEGQYEEADITFKEIAMAKEVFKTKLKNIYHARIAYPKN